MAVLVTGKRTIFLRAKCYILSFCNDRNGSTEWIHLLARSRLGSHIHLPMSQYKLFSLDVLHVIHILSSEDKKTPLRLQVSFPLLSC